MLKRLSCLSLIFFCANTISFASANGFYIGASGIKDNAEYDFKRVETAPSGPFLDQFRIDWSGEGFAGEVFAGYHYRFIERFDLGLEAFYDRSSNDGDIGFLQSNSLYTRELSGKYKQRWQYGLALKPGYYITDAVLLYGRLGWIKDNIQLSGHIIQTGSLGFFAGSFASDQDKEGLQLGIGTQIQIINQLHLRLEWDYNSLNNFSNSSQVKSSTGLQFVTYRTAFKPKIEQFKLGLSWEFA